MADKIHWSSWTSLGKPHKTELGRPFAQRNLDGRLGVFAIGLGGIFNIAQLSPNNGWKNAGPNKGKAASNVSIRSRAVRKDADGRLEIFAIPEGRALWHYPRV